MGWKLYLMEVFCSWTLPVINGVSDPVYHHQTRDIPPMLVVFHIQIVTTGYFFLPASLSHLLFLTHKNISCLLRKWTEVTLVVPTYRYILPYSYTGFFYKLFFNLASALLNFFMSWASNVAYLLVFIYMFLYFYLYFLTLFIFTISRFRYICVLSK